MSDTPPVANRRFFAGLEARFQPYGNMHVLEKVGPLPRIVLFMSLGVTINILVIGAFLFARNEPVAAWISIGIGVVTGVISVVYVITGRSVIVVRGEIATGVIGVLSMHIALGGYSWSGGWLAWSLLHITLVALLLPKTDAVFIVSLYTVAAIAFIFLEPALQRLNGDPPDTLVPAVLGADAMVMSMSLLAFAAGVLVTLLAREQSRNVDLLRNVLPDTIAQRLKDDPGVIADRFDECTVLFVDLVEFTAHSGEVEPDRLVYELNEVFSRFDELVANLGVEKIKTMGDGYMAVAGVPTPRPDHVEVICELAVLIDEEMAGLNRSLGTGFSVRSGIATGRAVAGVIGASRFSYDLWGDTVNLASRLQSYADPGQTLVSEEVAATADGLFRFRSLGEVELKGRGMVGASVLEDRATQTLL